MYTLYTTPLSANGRKVLAQSQLLGLQPDVRLVDVYRGEGRTAAYLAVNPTGKIPALVEGALTLTESNAILVYVSEEHGGGRLFARTTAGRARITSWLFWEAAHWQPSLVPVLAPFVGHALRPASLPEPEGAPDWANASLVPLLDRLEAELGDRPFLVGDEPTLADLSVGGMVTYFRTFGFPFDAYPAFGAWYARLESIAAWRGTAVAPWA